MLAGAGTGKTRTLVTTAASRIGVLGIPAHRVLAVTFTNKAAREMLDRLRVMLAGQAVPSWAGTFHGLGARMLRADPEVAGLRHGFEILGLLVALEIGTQTCAKGFASAADNQPECLTGHKQRSETRGPSLW